MTDPTGTLVLRRGFEQLLASAFRGTPVKLRTKAFVDHTRTGLEAGVRRGAQMVQNLRPGLVLGDGFVRAVLGSDADPSPVVQHLPGEVAGVYSRVTNSRHSLLAAEAELVGLARRAFLGEYTRGQLLAFDAAGGGKLGARLLRSPRCPDCGRLAGVPVPLSRALVVNSLLHRAPACRCLWLPAVPPGVPVWQAVPTTNVFCATGVGGGVDPTCGEGDNARQAIGPGEAKETAAALDAVDRTELLRARRKARAKFAAATVPTAEEAAAAQAKMAELGADRYESNIRGTNVDRANSRKKLLAEFGDGKTCPCVYCLTPNQRVLTADLRWVPIGDLTVGNRLVGFDEEPGDHFYGHRNYSNAVVEGVVWAKEQVYDVEMSTGQVITATAEHRWLAGVGAPRWLQTCPGQRTEEPVRVKRGGGRPAARDHGDWTRAAGVYEAAVLDRRPPVMAVAEEFGLGGGAARKLVSVIRQKGYLGPCETGLYLKTQRVMDRLATQVPYLFEPWTEATGRDDGYLAGILDGEGCLTKQTGLAFTQNAGLVLDKSVDILSQTAKRFGVKVTVSPWYPDKPDLAKRVWIGGPLSARVAFLGSIRPVRLLSKVDPGVFGRLKRRESHTVVSVRPAGVQEIVKVQTSTGTLVVEGYPHHNCGIRLDDGTVTRDKLYTAAEGGRYRHENLVPACLTCNKRRSDTPFKSIKWDRPTANVYCATGPGGGVDPTCTKGGGGPAPTGHEMVQSVAADLKQKFGYRGRLTVSADDPPPGGLEVDGFVGGLTAGDYHVRSGVTAYSKVVGGDRKKATDVLAHEMMHGVYDSVRQEYGREMERMSAGKLLKMDGSPKPALADRLHEFPVYAALHHQLTDLAGLAADDGVTPYSTAYWKGYGEKRSGFGHDLALNETLAEMAAVHAVTGSVPGSPRYRKLYQAIHDVYRTVKPPQPGEPTTNVGTAGVRLVAYFDAAGRETTPDRATSARVHGADGSVRYVVRNFGN